MTRATCRMIRRPTAALMPAGLEKVSRLARMQRAFDRRRAGRLDHGREINFVYTREHAKSLNTDYKIPDYRSSS